MSKDGYIFRYSSELADAVYNYYEILKHGIYGMLLIYIIC